MTCTIVCSQIKPAVVKTIKTNKKSTPVKAQIPDKRIRFAEVVNGRAAMQGILWGSLDWMASGENIIQQFEDPMYTAGAVGVVSALSVASLITQKDFDDEQYWSFTPEAELKNGRLAMLGFTALLGLSAM